MFSIGTNFTQDLLDGLEPFPQVVDLYGTLPRHVVGHGRPRTSVPQVTRQDVEKHVAAVHAAGREFSYLLNAPSMGGRQFGLAERAAILEHLDWLASIPVDSVTVSLADIAQLALTRHPGLKVKISHNCMVTTVEQVRMFEDLGASMVTVHGSVIRDFRLLEAMATAASIPIQVICTANCVRGCPNRISYHSSATAVLSSDRTADNPHLRHATGYCFSWCHDKKLEDHRRILMSGVRPEDLALFVAAGVTHFKLDTRVMRTPQILDRVNAYVLGRYEGDLKRIFSVFSLGYRTTTGKQMGGESLASDGGQPAVDDYYRVADLVDFDRALSIDNRELAGVLERFASVECPPDCGQCRFCDAFVDRAMASDPAEHDRMRRVLARYREWMFGR
jgi:collagenase-like PrtC family protease